MKKLSLKEIQKIQLNILIFLDKICKENNIKYYLSSGTLLGAVKYKGFIPWDDDIDVILFRDDYMKLMKVLKNQVENYKLLSIYNTKDYYYAFAKLVDTNTVLTENAKKIKDMGVYIDIVPMDGYISGNINKEIKNLRFIRNLMVKRYRIKNCKRSNFSYMKNQYIKPKNKFIKDIIYSFIDIITLPLGYSFYAKLYDKIISKNKFEDIKYLSVRTGSFGLNETFNKEDLLEQTEFEFENHKFTSFKNYDLYLNNKFGDYKKDPPKEQQISHHQFIAYEK